jgi:hypothetical protein
MPDDDPIANCSPYRRRRARRVYDSAMGISDHQGARRFTTDDLEGGAYWSPPGKWKMGVLQRETAAGDGLTAPGGGRLLARE